MRTRFEDAKKKEKVFIQFIILRVLFNKISGECGCKCPDRDGEEDSVLLIILMIPHIQQQGSQYY
jgi:hypothetical protein